MTFWWRLPDRSIHLLPSIKANILSGFPRPVANPQTVFLATARASLVTKQILEVFWVKYQAHPILTHVCLFVFFNLHKR